MKSQGLGSLLPRHGCETVGGAAHLKPDPKLDSMVARGIGEIGITGTGTAIANAIYHATGKRVRDLPITPDKLLREKLQFE